MASVGFKLGALKPQRSADASATNGSRWSVAVNFKSFLAGVDHEVCSDIVQDIGSRGIHESYPELRCADSRNFRSWHRSADLCSPTLSDRYCNLRVGEWLTVCLVLICTGPPMGMQALSAAMVKKQFPNSRL